MQPNTEFDDDYIDTSNSRKKIIFKIVLYLVAILRISKSIKLSAESTVIFSNCSVFSRDSMYFLKYKIVRRERCNF